MDSVMRTLWILFGAFVLSILALAALGELIPIPRNTELDIMVFAFGFVGLADLGLGFFLRRSALEPARETLRRDAGNEEARRAWTRGHVLGFAFAETVALFGVAIRFVTGNREYALPFYILGLAMLILWKPSQPDDA